MTFEPVVPAAILAVITVAVIATRLITMRQLMDWNKLDFETVKVGQQLKVKP